VNPAGQVLFNAHLPPDWESYRTYVLPWAGQPTEPPRLAVASSGGVSAGSTVYASWNGATEVASWRVLAGSSPNALATVAAAPKNGFETAIATPASVSGHYVTVQALNSAGAAIGVSATIKG
jgi:hypothetical protein